MSGGHFLAPRPKECDEAHSPVEVVGYRGEAVGYRGEAVGYRGEAARPPLRVKGM
jgi:hypothetical protein